MHRQQHHTLITTMSHIREEVTKVTKLGGWEKMFDELESRTTPYESRFPSLAASNEQNIDKNRYCNVFPYDGTRVKLGAGENGDYINASFVHIKSAHRKYILTQSPLQSTLGDFWRMIWEQKCPAIVMLNNYEEGHYSSCHPYIPEAEGDALVVDSEGTLITVLSRTQLPSYTRTKIQIDRSNKSLDNRTVVQYQYSEWPDYGVPECLDDFLNFLKAIRDSGALTNTEKEPVAIHCSAGVGRSGTFVLVDAALVLISENVKVDVISLLEDLRQCRHGLVQTPEQLAFAYDAIIGGIEKFIGPLDDVDKQLLEPHPR